MKSELYRYSDEMIVEICFIDLRPDEKEVDIQMKLIDVFQIEFPLILSNLLDFVQCCRKTTSTPTDCIDFK